MMLKTGISLFVVLFLFSACTSKLSTCPQYPKPSKDVLQKIQSLKDRNVNLWTIKQYKLNKQLKICNE